MYPKVLFSIIAMALLNSPSQGQDGASVCREIASNGARLACYDKAFPVAKSTTPENAKTMTMQDFLTDYRDLGGQQVKITGNLLQTGNMVFFGADSLPILNYAIISIDGLARDTRRKINTDCSNAALGSCQAIVTGLVAKDKTVPRLTATQITF